MIAVLAARLDLRSGELRPVTLLGLQYFLLLLAYYFLKPARDALFLTGAGSDVLPAAFVISALVAAPAAGAYGRLAARFPSASLTSATLLAMAVQLPFLYWLVGRGAVWTYFLFYAWVGVYGILATSQFWLLAGEVFDAGQARRVFPVLGVAGILGAFAGGELTRRATAGWGFDAADLLLAGALVTVLVAALTATTARRLPGRTDSRPRSGEETGGGTWRNLRLVSGSRLLSLIVGVIAVSILMTSLTDYLFKSVAAEQLPDSRRLASFLGSFYSATSLISLLIQVLLAGRLLRWLGTVGALAVLPTILLAGTAGLLVWPGLAAAMVLRGGDLVTKYSIQQTARELLFLPVAPELKRRTKVLIDVFADRFVRGAGGLALLAATALLGAGLRPLGVVALVLVAGWLALVVALRREYVRAFRAAIARRQIDPDELRRGVADAASTAALVEALDSGNERQIAYALDLLPKLGVDDLIPRLRALGRHDAAHIRRRSLEILAGLDGDDQLAAAHAALDDADLDVRAAAVDAVLRGAGDDLDRRLDELLAAGPRVRDALLVWVAGGDGETARRVEARTDLKAILDEGGPSAAESRRALALALRHSERTESRELLLGLVRDPAPDVAAAALESLGATRDPAFLPRLIEQLGDRRRRAAAREALVAYGPDGVFALQDCLQDTERPPIAREHSARALGAIEESAALDALLTAAATAHGLLRHEILRQAVRLRIAGVRPRLDRHAPRDLLDGELARWYGHAQAARALADRAGGPAGGLLNRALAERLREGLDNIFALLAMDHHPRGMMDAGVRLQSGEPRLRGQAVAYLEQALAPDLQAMILPAVDGRTADAVSSAGRELFGLKVRTADEALAYLAHGADDWLRACALCGAIEAGHPDLESLVRRATLDPAAIVRETAAAWRRTA